MASKRKGQWQNGKEGNMQNCVFGWKKSSLQVGCTQGSEYINHKHPLTELSRCKANHERGYHTWKQHLAQPWVLHIWQ